MIPDFDISESAIAARFDFYKAIAKCATAVFTVLMLGWCIQLYISAQIDIETKKMALRLAENDKKSCRTPGDQFRNEVR